jgi:hypothetical protein
MNELRFASLNTDTLMQIKQLEQQLNQEMNCEIVLLAYEKKDGHHAD